MRHKTEISRLTTGRTARRRLLPGLKVGEGFTLHPFDAKFGVRTSGLVAGRDLKCGHPHDRHSTAYYGIAPSVFRILVKRWLKSYPAVPIEEFNFIDIGAGMGRAVLLAAELPFRQVVGVELNPTLVQIARKNLTVWRSNGRALSSMKIVCQDAAEFMLPTGPCLAFLFNPFGAPVMRRLLGSWRKALGERPQPLDILYVNNEQECVFEKQAGFTRLFKGQMLRSRADAIADHRILANQPDGEYASSNSEDCSIWRWEGANDVTQ